MATVDAAVVVAQGSTMRATAFHVLPVQHVSITQGTALAVLAEAMWPAIGADPLYWRALPNSAGMMFPGAVG